MLTKKKKKKKSKDKYLKMRSEGEEGKTCAEEVAEEVEASKDIATVASLLSAAAAIASSFPLLGTRTMPTAD